MILHSLSADFADYADFLLDHDRRGLPPYSAVSLWLTVLLNVLTCGYAAVLRGAAWRYEISRNGKAETFRTVRRHSRVSLPIKKICVTCEYALRGQSNHFVSGVLHSVGYCEVHP